MNTPPPIHPPALHNDSPSNSTLRPLRFALLFTLSLGLSACGAINDQEFECAGFDEQRTVASDQPQTVISSRRVPQEIDFHVRQDYVLVKSFRAERLPASTQGAGSIAFAMTAPKARIEGSFDPNSGMLSYSESHETRIDNQAQTTLGTGVYRCKAL